MFSRSTLPMATIFMIKMSLLAVTSAKVAHQSVMMNMPTVQNLDAKCGRSGMTVHVFFDQPFSGVIYSKGHYSNKECHYVTEKNTGNTNYTFLIPINKCGTDGRLEDPTVDEDMYYQNTIIIQLDPLITEIWDEAFSMKCIWPYSFMKKIDFKPIKVVDPQFVDVLLTEESVNTLMTVQRKGKSILDQPVTGYIYQGEETSAVFYVHDKEMDANVLNCSIAMESGRREQLVDQFGCINRPDVMSFFGKSRTSNGVQADLMLYSYIKGLPTDSKFQLSCQLQLCKGECVIPCVNGPVYSGKRKRRSLQDNLEFDNEHQMDHPILVIEREQLFTDKSTTEASTPFCRLSQSILIAGLTLLSIVALLSILSCYLAFKLSKVTSSNKR